MQAKIVFGVLVAVLLSAFKVEVVYPKSVVNGDPIPRKATAVRISERIKVDGQLNEKSWLEALPTFGFTELEPVPGKRARFATEVRVLYDDFSVYFGIDMEDPYPDSILKELSLRDQIGNTDWVLIQIDPYKTGQLAFEFVLTASGVQVERKLSSPNIRDASWDAVWMSAVQIHDHGWTAEIEIPFSALRFPTKDIQEWNINFARYVRRYREEYWWNPIDPNISNRLHQCGILQGIAGVKAPPRIILTPFFSTYVNHLGGRDARPWHYRFTGGLDTKIGLSDAFTLDATLIPDFGQVRFDDIVLNLSPFEIQLEEFRPFFTEGTELFNRGGIFYSRRIGDLPFYLRQSDWRLRLGLQGQQGVPQKSPLINATKISGRTNSGLGVGVFNAVEGRLFLPTEDENGQHRKVLINPLTNYNLAVVDQILPNNSFVSFTNASVVREGEAYNSNVSAIEFALRDRANAWMISGNGALSAKMYEGNPLIGHTFSLSMEKTKGVWQYGLNYNELSNTYDPNDLGFLNRNNERSISAPVNYYIFSPRGILNYANVNFTPQAQFLYAPNVRTRYAASINSFFMTRDFFAFSFYSILEPFRNRDFFDPRTADFSIFYLFPKNYLVGGFISTDYRKPFAIDINGNFRWFDEEHRNVWFLRVSPRFRLSDHLFFILRSEYFQFNQDVGFVSRDSRAIGFESLGAKDVLYATRNQRIVINTITGRYNFDPLNSLFLTLRHYWTGVDFTRFHLVDSRGLLVPTAYTGRSANNDDLHGLNLTLFNIDLIYSWRFAPGSDLFIMWKNIINDFSRGLQSNYLQSLFSLPHLPQENGFSLRLIYYLDYALLKRKWHS